MRYLAIDYGTRRTGLAICDPQEKIVSPLEVVRGQKSLLSRIARIVRERQVDAVVVGLPLNMDDSEGPQARLVRQFASKLRAHLDIPVYFEDERLSSFAARQELASAGLGKSKAGGRLDAVAAAEILEAFLERKGRSRRSDL